MKDPWNNKFCTEDRITAVSERMKMFSLFARIVVVEFVLIIGYKEIFVAFKISNTTTSFVNIATRMVS